MDMTSERFIPASPADTWAALNDPAMLKECIPGCDVFERTGDDGYAMQMLAKIGPVSARFKGAMTMQDVQAPQSYVIVFQGEGGMAGFAKGSAKVELAPQVQDGVDGTLMRYTAEAQIGGKLAQIGSRLVDAAARKTADDFFERFVTRLSPTAATADEADADGSEKKGLWAKSIGWISGKSAKGAGDGQQE